MRAKVRGRGDQCQETTKPGVERDLAGGCELRVGLGLGLGVACLMSTMKGSMETLIGSCDGRALFAQA